MDRILLDAFAQRHNSYKIYQRQLAVAAWMRRRKAVYADNGHILTLQQQLAFCDICLREASSRNSSI